MNYVIGIIIIAAVIAIALVITKRSDNKRLAQDWTGVVVKKWIATYSDDDGNVTKTPTIRVQIDGGKKKKYSVTSATFNSLSEGDKVKKTAGQRDPVKA